MRYSQVFSGCLLVSCVALAGCSSEALQKGLTIADGIKAGALAYAREGDRPGSEIILTGVEGYEAARSGLGVGCQFVLDTNEAFVPGVVARGCDVVVAEP